MRPAKKLDGELPFGTLTAIGAELRASMSASCGHFPIQSIGPTCCKGCHTQKTSTVDEIVKLSTHSHKRGKLCESKAPGNHDQRRPGAGLSALKRTFPPVRTIVSPRVSGPLAFFPNQSR